HEGQRLEFLVFFGFGKLAMFIHMRRVNPFVPNNPVHPGMFSGRNAEIKSIDRALFQTKNGNPTHILLIGERGIGKTSLMLFAEAVARGEIPNDRTGFDFITVRFSLMDNMTLSDLAFKISEEVKKALDGESKALEYINKIWSFAKRLDLKTPMGGVSIKEEISQKSTTQIISELTHSLSETIDAVTIKASTDLGLIRGKDGLVIMIDEADKASSDLNLGAFLKNLTEALPSMKTNKLLIILSGLPELRQVLVDSHPSSLRLFDDYELRPLSKEEVEEVISAGIHISNTEISGESKKLRFEQEAVSKIFEYSEGYPHFVQQICASSFDVNTDDILSNKDIDSGFFGEKGALDRIGDRYYQNIYQQCPKFSREILVIMAEKGNRWVSREEIKKAFRGKAGSLDQGIKTLKEKGAILKKGDSRGEYRLQWRSFAFWLKFRSIQESADKKYVSPRV
ncbi:AAA family ATPase, partial [Candidatus Curtissbacteria bacterium]|nr:AAA family ATPase [Candidatus Curtissbacteria bacterium]